MTNECKPITRTIKGTEPWMPDQVQVRVRGKGEDNWWKLGWLLGLLSHTKDRLIILDDGQILISDNVEPIFYEPAPKKYRTMTPLEAYVFLRDGGYIFKHKDYPWNVWNTPGAVRYNLNVQDMHYAEPKEPLEWHELPQVEVE